MAVGHLLSSLWLALLVGAVIVAANTEKAIFVAGPQHPASDKALSMVTSRLPRLTPDADGNTWRTGLPAVFPWADTFPLNGTTWVLLDNLTEGQRYELRVCWAATQPTEFAIDVYDLREVAASPGLSSSLSSFVERYDGTTTPKNTPSTSSLLRIIAAADFVAADRSAMHPDRVPPVLTDIILDPYLLNAVPRSLLPVVAVILAVAGVSGLLARRVILPQLRAVAVDTAGTSETKAQNVQKKTR
ncbi:hypothetical protein Sste5346_004408 [Sporothrix stenoceras]|uniref:Uncharacterized protein n=1 Tax=Sporothrix stenoceras TaxID=5173 RepID=A0ABR3Z9M8_9PEZI